MHAWLVWFAGSKLFPSFSYSLHSTLFQRGESVLVSTRRESLEASLFIHSVCLRMEFMFRHTLHTCYSYSPRKQITFYDYRYHYDESCHTHQPPSLYSLLSCRKSSFWCCPVLIILSFAFSFAMITTYS